jgi:hypothetical protein
MHKLATLAKAGTLGAANKPPNSYTKNAVIAGLTRNLGAIGIDCGLDRLRVKPAMTLGFYCVFAKK